MVTPSSTRPDLRSLRIDEGKRKSGKTGKRLGIAAALLGVVVLAGGGIFALRNSRATVDVAIAQKVASGRPALLSASGYVTPRRRATLAAKITGRVTRVLFDEGMRVHQGQVLTTLDDLDAKRALESARADRDSSEAAIAD